jgi:hypothetical protein
LREGFLKEDLYLIQEDCFMGNSMELQDHFDDIRKAPYLRKGTRFVYVRYNGWSSPILTNLDDEWAEKWLVRIRDL